MRTILLAALALASCSTEQRPDSDADVSVQQPRFERGTGPRVLIDGGHGNLHTEETGFAPFAALLRNDGFRVGGLRERLTLEALANVDVLVIVNAENPAGGSAFTAEEVAAVRTFVEQGGALLLIADHIPYPDSAAALATAFGVTLQNNFADYDGEEIFTRSNGGLTEDPLLAGIDSIATFSGSTMETSDPQARPLLRLWPGWTVQTPSGDGLSPERPAGNVLQGVALERGKGRVAVFGEAAMFTAQTSEGLFGERIGFHADGAGGNRTLILRLLHWLAEPRTLSNGVAASSGRPYIATP